MNELIKLYNNKYSKIEYPKTKLDFYYVYLFLQNKIIYTLHNLNIIIIYF